LHDLLILCSSWLLCVYTIFTMCYWQIISIMSTSIRIFRGRKFNTIRGRDDSNTFNVAEMYLSVMLISLSLFLLPTLAIFYFYAFISIILRVMILQIFLVVLQIVFTEFPYFLLVWSLWNPYILPGGMRVTADLRLVPGKVSIGSCFN